MSQIKIPPPGLVFASFLYNKDFCQEEKLITFWPTIYGEPTYFTHSFCPMKRYYSDEMGEINRLERFFLVGQTPTDRSELKQAKFWAIETEEKFLNKETQKRALNLDVGMLTLENIQLATGKNFTHRVYLGDGIFSDLTLIYQRNNFQTLPWSYPDYSHPEVMGFFKERRKFLQSIIVNHY